MEGKASSSSVMGSHTFGEPGLEGDSQRQQEEGVEIEMGSNAGSSAMVAQVPNVNVEEILQTIRAMKAADASGGENASSGIVEGEGTQVLSAQIVKVSKALGKLEPKEDGQKESELSLRKLAACVLPEEIWRIILGKVPAPTDLWNCTNTCQLFETILRPWKTGWMLGQALPYLYRHLPGKKLLECRLVSKGWNDAVDHFLEDHPSLRPYDGARDPRRLEFVCPLKEKRISERSCFLFENGHMITLGKGDLGFVRMSDQKQLPFIGRYMTLALTSNPFEIEDEEIDDGDEDVEDGDQDVEDGDEDVQDGDEDENATEKSWDRLYDFLQLYGREIWYLHVIFFYDFSSPRLVQKGFEFSTTKVFQYLPNLRKYSMDNSWVDFHYSPFADLGIDAQSLPGAPKLETLSWPDYALYDNVMEALIGRHHLQLRKLVLMAGPWERARLLDWPNLTELHVDFDRMDEEDQYQWNLPDRTGVDLKLLCGVGMPNLCKLILNLPRGYVSCDQLLEAINELASTTRLSVIRIVGSTLHLTVGAAAAAVLNLDSDSDSAPAPPSQIKNLELSPPFHTRPLWDWDFLWLCFPFVENLNVFVEEHEDSPKDRYGHECSLMSIDGMKQMKDPNQLLEVNEYIFDGQMYKSNIWEMLPNLKVFSFQWDVFTREGFEAYANGGNREGAK